MPANKDELTERAVVYLTKKEALFLRVLAKNDSRSVSSMVRKLIKDAGVKVGWR